MKKILFPTDFSKTSNNAFAYACLLAEALDAQIDIVNVYNVSFGGSAFLPYENFDTEVIVEDKKKAINEKMDELLKIYPSERVKNRKLIYGVFTATEIADYATVGNFDLIVMGMKGEHDRIEKFMGTVTTDLMMKAPCPVLAVPENALFEGIQNIAFATDLNPNDDKPIEKAFDFAEDIGAELHFVYVDNLVYRKKKAMSTVEMKDSPELQYTKVINPSITDGLQAYLEKNPMDILSLYIPQRRLWERLFHSRTTKALAFHTDIPLLVIHE